MENLDSTAFDNIFGLKRDVSTHERLLQSAIYFTQLRKHIQQDKTKLSTFTSNQFHKSTKKATFTNAIKNGLKCHKIEYRVLKPLFDEKLGSMPMRVSLQYLILACFSLNSSQFKQLEKHKLLDIFPRLLVASFSDVAINEGLEETLHSIMKRLVQEDDSGGLSLLIRGKACKSSQGRNLDTDLSIS